MTYHLPERCDRAAALALLPELAQAVGDQPLQIDGTAARQVGQAMLQLLVSARRTGAGAVITGSQALREAALLAGLSEELFAEQVL